MTNKCDNCIHNSVCKYKEMYLKTLKDFQNTKYEFPIKLEISCYQFKNDELSQILISKDIVDIHPCEGCDIFEEMKNRIKKYKQWKKKIEKELENE